ncbi:MAG: hypothetical protein GX943_01900, partial [Candidatus Pacebacteria bacterium]|nr:hypothetical protein [Candidatus Paceibacterota bacterium]
MQNSQKENTSKSTTRVIRRRVGGQNNDDKNTQSVSEGFQQDSKNSNNSSNSNDSNNPNNSSREQETIVSGILDNSKDGHGILRPDFSGSERDAYIASSQIRRLRLKPGDLVSGPARQPKDNERYWGLLRVDSINGRSVEEHRQLNRKNFLSLTPVFPDKHIKLEIDVEP